MFWVAHGLRWWTDLATLHRRPTEGKLSTLRSSGTPAIAYCMGGNMTFLQLRVSGTSSPGPHSPIVATYVAGGYFRRAGDMSQLMR